MGEGLGERAGFGEGFFVFCEACSPLPMGEGPGVRAGFGEGFLWVFVACIDENHIESAAYFALAKARQNSRAAGA